MAIWRVRKVRESGEREVNATNVAVVEAANSGAAIAAAQALSSEFHADYWANAVVEDLEAAPFLGLYATEVVDKGF